MPVTYTATSFLSQPRAVHAGLNSQTFRYNSGSQAISAGDVIFLAKVPYGATLVDVVEHHTDGATSCLVSYGYDATLSAFIASGTGGQVNRLAVGANLGTQFTGSDDAVARYSILKAKKETGSSTTSLKLVGNIQYTMGD